MDLKICTSFLEDHNIALIYIFIDLEGYFQIENFHPLSFRAGV